jgi:ABC-type multidrug transport system ATPase subunit
MRGISSGPLGVAAAMPLLELDRVSKRYGHGTQERVALRGVSLEIESGEFVAVWGRRRSGRSTLLRIAAGVEPPDEGVVRFAGRDLSAHDDAEGSRGGVRYCRKAFRRDGGQHVLDQLVTSQLTHGVSVLQARSRARSALERTGAERCAALRPSDLGSTEVMRVMIARALVHRPEVLVIDEPTLGVDLRDRDRILLLLHSLADEGVAILMSAEETSCLSESRALSLSAGKLRGELRSPELPPVAHLHDATRWSASA